MKKGPLPQLTLGLVGLVAMADLFWSPALAPLPPLDPVLESAAWGPPGSVAQATQMLVESRSPRDWARRRSASAYLLKALDPPRDHRSQWAALTSQLDSAFPAASAWECWRQGSAPSVAAGGLFGAYQNRLSGLRILQLEGTAQRLRPILEKNDYLAYQVALPLQGDTSGPLSLALWLQPLARVSQPDLIAYPLWWQILANQSNQEALRAGSQLAQGKTPGMQHRWENGVCVCWTAGPDGKDEAGGLAASLDEIPESPPGGDWIYRFR